MVVNRTGVDLRYKLAKAAIFSCFEPHCGGFLFSVHNRGSGKPKVFAYLGNCCQSVCRFRSVAPMAFYTGGDHPAWEAGGAFFRWLNYSRRSACTLPES